MNDLPLLKCSHLSKNYQNTHLNIKILTDINLIVKKREIVTIVGHSGSGKSTLLHLLGGLDTPSQGKVVFEGQVLHQISKKVLALIHNQRLGFIYQFHHLLSDFNALENVTMPLMINGEKFKHAKIIGKRMLKLVGLSHRENHYSNELSGGERQRVAIARALINQPVLILADEPTGSLDQKTSRNIFKLLQEINTYYGTTFLIVTHDTYLCEYSHKILKLHQGKLKT